MNDVQPSRDPGAGAPAESARVGRYAVLRRLGAGGMGVVFLARHIHLDKLFALKIISPRFLDDPQIGQRFLLEARAASKIDHVNVVSITDFGPPEDGPAFFAMELLDGEDLAKLIAREGPVPGFGIGMTAGEAAHIGMFDDGKQCLFCTEFPHELYGCINVDQVVVRNFFAVQLGKQFRQVTDERCLLVWVFAVAQRFFFCLKRNR